MYLKKITNSKSILFNINIVDFISSKIDTNCSVIYFSNKFTNDKILSRSNIITISENSSNTKGITFSKIDHRILKYILNQYIIIIDIDDEPSFKYMKYLIKNLMYLFKFLKKYNMDITYTYYDFNVLCALSCDSSMKYFEDICVAFKALISDSKYQKFEIIYDYVCDYLDKQFTDKNLCGFCNDVCDASRNGLTHKKVNGCCYKFEYGPGGIIISHKPCKYLIDRHCIANCISCKLHTCYYLKSKNIQFKIREILLLNCFFTFKQQLVLKYNVFRPKEEILNKLMHVNFIPFIIYYPFSLYKIED